MKNILCALVLVVAFISSNAQIRIGASFDFGVNHSFATESEFENLKKGSKTIYVCRTEDREEEEIVTNILKEVWNLGDFEVINRSELEDYIQEPNTLFISLTTVALVNQPGTFQSAKRVRVKAYSNYIHFWGVRYDKKRKESGMITFATVKLKLDSKSEEKVAEIDQNNKKDNNKALSAVSEWITANGTFESYSSGTLKLYLGCVSNILKGTYELDFHRRFGQVSSEITNLNHETLYMPQKMLDIRNDYCEYVHKYLDEKETLKDLSVNYTILDDEEYDDLLLSPKDEKYVLVYSSNIFMIFNVKTYRLIFTYWGKDECFFDKKGIAYISKVIKKLDK